MRSITAFTTDSRLNDRFTVTDERILLCTSATELSAHSLPSECVGAHRGSGTYPFHGAGRVERVSVRSARSDHSDTG